MHGETPFNVPFKALIQCSFRRNASLGCVSDAESRDQTRPKQRPLSETQF